METKMHVIQLDRGVTLLQEQHPSFVWTTERFATLVQAAIDNSPEDKRLRCILVSQVDYERFASQIYCQYILVPDPTLPQGVVDARPLVRHPSDNCDT